MALGKMQKLTMLGSVIYPFPILHRETTIAPIMPPTMRPNKNASKIVPMISFLGKVDMMYKNFKKDASQLGIP